MFEPMPTPASSSHAIAFWTDGQSLMYRAAQVVAVVTAIAWGSALGVFGSTSAFAQAEKNAGFKVIPTATKFADVATDKLSGDARRAASSRNSESRRARNDGRKAAREGIENGNMAPVKDYFNGYIFPRMTQPEELKEAGDLRDSFFRTYMKSDLSEANRKKLISEVIMPAMQAIASGKEYAPAARLNAVALIGRLDETALVRSGTRVTPPRPSAQAFDFLTQLLQDAAIEPWLKASSIQGIVRHLMVDAAVNGRLLGDDQRDLLQAFAMNTLDNKSAGQDTWSADLDYWLKRRSVQLLGVIGRAGENGSVLAKLTSIAGDEKQKVWMQLDAVKALRRIDYTGLNADQVSKVMLTLTEFMQRHLSAEAKSIGDQLEDLIYKNILYNGVDFVASGSKYERNIAKSSGGMGMGMDMEMEMGEMMDMGMGAMGGMGSMGLGKKPAEPVYLVELPTYQLNLARRRMKIFAFSANDVMQNAKGLEAAASAKDKQLRLAVGKFTEKFMSESSIGIVDVSKEDEEEIGPDGLPIVQQESYTSQLQEVCRDGATNLQTILTRYAGGNVAPGAEAGDSPSGSSNPFGIR